MDQIDKAIECMLHNYNDEDEDLNCSICNIKFQKPLFNAVQLNPCEHLLCPYCALDTFSSVNAKEQACECPVDGCHFSVASYKYLKPKALRKRKRT